MVGLLGGLVLFASVCSGAVFHVSPAGRDDWSGRQAQPKADRTDGPFATLHRACRAAGATDAGARTTITIAPGAYFLDEPVVLDARHDGLTIEAELDGTVRIYGGRQINGWKRDGERFYAAELSGVREGAWDFRSLIVNGRYCPRARLPERGRFEHESRFDVPWMSTTGGGWKRKPTEKELTTLKYEPDDLGPWLNVRNVEITVYHMWDESMVGVAAMDADARTLTFSSPTGHPPGAFGVRQYVVWNVREGLTQPGQWYLDRTRGKVVYWPLPGEDMAAATVFAPTVKSIVALKGTKDKPVRNVTVRRLTLAVTTTPLKAGGFGAGRFDGALSAAGAEGCSFADLEILHAGGQGVKIDGKDLRIERCHVHHVGACGIRFRGDGVVVADNHVHDVGLTYPSAIALTGGGSGCRIVHNHVHHAPYSAVTCGGANHRIEHNRIHHAMQQLHDGGGIYCFAGRDLVLRGNFIHDIVDTGGYGASAYYLDERSEGCLVEGNLSVNVVRPSHNHMAKGNTIRNNVFINGGDLRLTFPRSSNYIFEKNVLRAGGRIRFENFEAIGTAADNILFSEQGTVECRKLDRYRQSGDYTLESDGANLLADPELISFKTGKVEFAPDSPAGELGIAAIDVRDAGPR
jgi:hypothetical protein